MEGEQAIQLPSLAQQVPFFSSWNVVGEQADENVARVKVARPIVAPEIFAVLREGTPIRGDLVKGVRPGVGNLRSKPVYIGNTQGSLQRIVV